VNCHFQGQPSFLVVQEEWESSWFFGIFDASWMTLHFEFVYHAREFQDLLLPPACRR
jgi:hypothetical protein